MGQWAFTHEAGGSMLLEVRAKSKCPGLAKRGPASTLMVSDVMGTGTSSVCATPSDSGAQGICDLRVTCLNGLWITIITVTWAPQERILV